MNKLATLSLVAVATLGLAACGGETTSNTLTIDNEVVLNSEDPSVDNLAANPTLADNVFADNASVDAANTSVDLNTTTTNTVE